MEEDGAAIQPKSFWLGRVCHLVYVMVASPWKGFPASALMKNKNKIFLIYKEIQSGAVANSYIRKSFLIYEEMCKYFPIYEEAVSHIWLCNRSTLISLYTRKIFFSFLSVWVGTSEWAGICYKRINYSTFRELFVIQYYILVPLHFHIQTIFSFLGSKFSI